MMNELTRNITLFSSTQSGGGTFKKASGTSGGSMPGVKDKTHGGSDSWPLTKFKAVGTGSGGSFNKNFRLILGTESGGSTFSCEGSGSGSFLNSMKTNGSQTGGETFDLENFEKGGSSSGGTVTKKPTLH